VQNHHLIFFLRPDPAQAHRGAVAALVAMGAGAPGIDGQSSGTKSRE
jgi:hypothetical protein